MPQGALRGGFSHCFPSEPVDVLTNEFSQKFVLGSLPLRSGSRSPAGPFAGRMLGQFWCRSGRPVTGGRRSRAPSLELLEGALEPFNGSLVMRDSVEFDLNGCLDTRHNVLDVGLVRLI